LTIAQALKEEMLNREASIAWAGDADLLITAYMKTKGKVQHPLNRVKAVIDAARKSPLFENDGYIRACDSSGTREVLHPCFKLKKSQGKRSSGPG
jgi:hypothetical protein